MAGPTNGTTTNGATTNGGEQRQSRYRVLEQLHSQRVKWKIICVGAGASGLSLAYSCEKRMKDYELTIYERNANIGGTWLKSELLRIMA
jgi:ribulose 1,5-bisphosphate synthetase/thiazole synthase